MKEIFKEVLKEISLSEKEEKDILKKTEEFIKILSKYIKKKIIVGGSLSKGTLIKKDKQDVDIFVIFDDEDETKNLEFYVKKIGIKYEALHGSRDYLRVREGNIFFEIVPLVKIRKKEEVKNVTDFSPLHVTYIKNKIKNNSKLKEEIKLAKAFCQANEIYGAESYIRGFSGYAIEVLICYYGTFLKFLKKIQKDRFIDVERYYKNEKEARREINEQKISSPLILIDPVYKYRNLCAGLSEESFSVLKDKAKEFLKKPSLEFFRRKTFDEKEFFNKAKKSKAVILILDLYSLKEKEDVAATKMKKFFDFLKEEFEKKQQKILDSKFVYSGGKSSKAFFSILIKEKIKIFGPKREMIDSLKRFRLKRKKVYFEKGLSFSYEKFNLGEFLGKQKIIAKSMGVLIKKFKSTKL
ncbi:MAG: nucleotidyltransferase domain-containing protein [Candidatus Pacearchaeota archaeon]